MRSHLTIHYLFFGLQHSSCNCTVSVPPLLQMPQSRGHAAALADSSTLHRFSHPHPGAGAGRCHPHKCLVARCPGLSNGTKFPACRPAAVEPEVPPDSWSLESKSNGRPLHGHLSIIN